MLSTWWFLTVVLEKTLENPFTARRSNQSILKDINPVYSSEGLMLKLKLQYFGHLMPRADSLKKTLMLGRIWGHDEKGPQRMSSLHASLTQRAWVRANSRRQQRRQKNLPGCNPWHHKESDMTEWLNINTQSSVWVHQAAWERRQCKQSLAHILSQLANFSCTSGCRVGLFSFLVTTISKVKEVSVEIDFFGKSKVSYQLELSRFFLLLDSA